MQKCRIQIAGMHCRSCEILIEDELRKIPGVTSAFVSHQHGTADIEYEKRLDSVAVEKAVENAGYRIGKEEIGWISKRWEDYHDVMYAALIAAGLYVVAKITGIFNLTGGGNGNFGSLPVVFLVGLTAGISTCMALVGGLVLGVTAKYAKSHPEFSSAKKFAPHLWFNLGRIGSYFVLGGVIGWLGSIFKLSPVFIGLLTVVVGITMLVVGGQLIELFPILKKVSFTLPTGIARALGINNRKEAEYSHKNAIALGAMTFFLPCGFTQAMQLYAMSTGSPIAGALTMGTFAVGTAPGLLGVGGLASTIKGSASRIFFKTAGVVVLLLAVFNINNGLNLLGISRGGGTVQASVGSDPNVKEVNGVQEVRMTQEVDGYKPNSFTIKKGIPVRWIVNSVNPNSCAGSIVSAQLGVRTGLQLGENVIEFTPDKAGAIRFSCIMGMYTGVFNVVDPTSPEASQGAVQPPAAQPQAAAGSCGSGGGGCGCGSGAKKQVPQTSGETQTTGQIQLIKATYTEDKDIVPNQFTVKANQPVRFEIDAKDDGYGCMGSVTLPGLVSKVDVFTKDKTTVFEFTPTKTGSFNITCAMGVPRGQIIVN